MPKPYAASGWRRLADRLGLAVVLALVSGAGGTAAEILLVEVTLNGQLTTRTAQLLARDGRLYLDSASLAALRIVAPQPTLHEGPTGYVDLERIAGLTPAVDRAASRLDLRCPATCFGDTDLRQGDGLVEEVAPGATALFLDYDLFADTQRETSSAALLTEVGLSTPRGVLSQSSTTGVARGDRRIVRLDTAWTSDRPASMRRLIVGDAITSSITGTAPVRFGGVRLGTDLSLRPGFVAFPTLGYSGAAALPSTLEVYADNVLRLRRDVPAGPFAIDQLPLNSGGGTARVVVRDILGREQEAQLPYYVPSQLLRAGLLLWSTELGALRDRYGEESFGYRQPFVAGSARYGLSDRLTLEAQPQLSPELQSLTAGAGIAVPHLGSLALTGSAAAGENGAGVLGRLGWDRQQRRLSLSAAVEAATPAYRQLGDDGGADRPRWRGLVDVGLDADRAGSFGVSLIAQTGPAAQDLSSTGVFWSLPLWGNATLSLNATQNWAPDRATAAVAFLTIPLGGRRFATVTLRADDAGVASEVGAAQHSGALTGLDVDASAETGQRERVAGGLGWRTERGDLRLDVAQSDGVTAGRANLTGSLVAMAGDLHVGRPLAGAFGLVSVAGVPGVRVSRDNQPLGRTDADGNIFVPDLRPYEKNEIGIDANDLPLAAAPVSDRIEVVPPFRGAVRIAVPVRGLHPLYARIVLPDGSDVPKGAVVHVEGHEARAPILVGSGGRIYVDEAPAPVRLAVEHEHGSCAAVIETVPPPDLSTPAGPFPCR